MDYLANLLPNERENLKKRWQAYNHDMEWTSCKEFMSWAAANGYKKGLHLKKIDESKKHGPNNSHYEDSKEKELMRAENTSTLWRREARTAMDARMNCVLDGVQAGVMDGDSTGSITGIRIFTGHRWSNHLLIRNCDNVSGMSIRIL